MALSVLAIAVASGKAGYVYLQSGKLMDWGLTVKATESTSAFAGYVQALINRLKPDVVVTQALTKSCRKGERTRALIRTAAEIASHNYLLDIAIERMRRFPSKYEEAMELAKCHPALTGYLPKRKRTPWEDEPRRMIVFEALVLAEAARAGPAERFAAALG